MTERIYIDPFGKVFHPMTEDDLATKIDTIKDIVLTVVEECYLDDPLVPIDFIDKVEAYVMADHDLMLFLPTEMESPIVKAIVKMGRATKKALNA